jgi:cysteine desulfuration protein SufE
MSPAEKEKQLIAKLSLIEDVQERLAWVVDRARKLPPLSDTARTEENRVQGCVSRVWVAGTVEDGRCRFRVDADSTLVKGLAWLLCETCDSALPSEVAGFTPSVLDALRLSEHLSPTRQNGLAQVARKIRAVGETNLA